MSYPLTKLDSVISFIRGVTFKPTDLVEPYSDGSIIVMRTKNVQVMGLDESDLIAIPIELVKREEQHLRDNDLLISSANSWNLVGKSSYISSLGYKATAGGFISIVRPQLDKIDARYLYHWVMASENQHKIRYCGRQTTNISNLDVGRFKELEIPLPSLSEQKRIAAILDKADSLRRKRQQAIQLADQFLRSVFLDLFGDPVTNPKEWEGVKLGSLCKVGSSKRVFVSEFTESGIPFYRGTEVGKLAENKGIQPHLYISNDHYKNLKKHSGVPEIGDLLLPSICHDGRIWKVDEKAPFYFKDGRVLWIKVNKSLINSDYLRSYLRNLFLVNYSSIASGTTFIELKIVNLKDLSVLNPPLDLQIKFAEITEKAMKKYVLNKAFLEIADKLFYSLSQKAFAGQL